MNRFTLAAVATIVGTGSAMAGGLDRSGQNINLLFEEGNIAELTFGYVAPDLSGDDGPLAGPLAGRSSGDAAGNYFQGALGYKQDINDRLSFAVIVDQPYGANIAYPAFVPPAGGGSALLGGTTATLDSSSVTGLLRYKFNDRFSVHGGIRAQQINASVDLRGGGYGPLNGYSADLDGDTAFGFQIGGAYEIPEIALRIAVTYFSEIDHDFDTQENIVPGVTSNTEVTTPEAVNISFQTGIAKDTLLFASFRYADYSVVQVTPTQFGINTGGASLTNIDDARDYTIGIGRRFNDKFAGSVTLNYSDGGADDQVSPLAPSNGSYGITIGGSYQVNPNIKLSGGVNYTRIGDAVPTVAGNELSDFEDNSAVGVGFKIGYTF
ncbi:OmpP1/FadL family transporter [Jannaschia marina]|uniref:OmpP1/FadL family transporter n=1 Tax=Jannaschia marina TaxID=2741674 RepID=UPI0015C8B397|nr:outer membrane protein transport protein [Jannaschia marina]